MKKVYDLAVKVGTYTDRSGSEKGRYENIGSIMQKDDGGKFIMLKRTFNPAGVPNPENRDSLLVSMFEPKENDGGGRQSAPAKAAPAAQQQSKRPAQDDDIPF